MVVISTWPRVQPFTRMPPTAQTVNMCSGSLWNKDLSLSHVRARALCNNPFAQTDRCSVPLVDELTPQHQHRKIVHEVSCKKRISVQSCGAHGNPCTK